MKTKSDSMQLTKIQGIIAILSFSAGTVIGAVCLFFIPPLGEISSTAISLVSEFLILCGALLGVKVAYDVKLMKFENEVTRRISNHNERPDD